MAGIDWAAAVGAINARDLPYSSGECRVLRPDSWNKYDMLFTKIRFGRFRRSG
jgi:hypothetical protein